MQRHKVMSYTKLGLAALAGVAAAYGMKNSPYGAWGPVNPMEFYKAQQRLEDAFKGYQNLLKKHDFSQVQYGHQFDKKLQAAYDKWDVADRAIQGQVRVDWDRHLSGRWPE